MNPQFFVGYGQLEALLTTHEQGRPLYAMLASETATSQHNVQIVNYVLIISDVQDGVGRIWRRRVGRFSRVGEHPLERPEDVKRAHDRANAAYALLVNRLILGQRLQVHNGTIATPKDLTVVEGDTDLFHYDHKTDRFVEGPLPEAGPSV